MTTDIIIYHKLTKSMEEQVIGRAQRIGRKDSLKVTYLQFDSEYLRYFQMRLTSYKVLYR
mgnify:CR=1 FL=1